MGKIIGIDLGTTNSCVAIMDGKEPKVITNQEGERTTPSVVAYTKSGEFIVGRAARNQAVTNPQNTVYSAKRFIGSSYSERRDEAGRVPYKVKDGSSGRILFQLVEQELTPQEISAKVLLKIKEAAEAFLGESVTQAVITVPAYFNDSQRQATKDAGKIAGLDVLRIINEPTAAALAYGLDKKTNQKIAVYDFGGGTFDVSILEVGDGVVEVLATNGDTHLGGDNIDERLIEWLVAEFKKDAGIDISKDPMAMQRLREAAEKAKIELSSRSSTEINLPYLTANETGPKHLQKNLSRSEFEQKISDIIERTIEPCRACLKDAGLSLNEIDEVVFVGGSTRIPLVSEKVKAFFGKEPNRSVNPDEVVALGAAVQGAVLAGDKTDILLLDVTPLSLGIETLGGVMTVMISRNTTIPCKKSEVYSTAADNQTSVDIKVCQGERQMARDNRVLGNFQLSDIPAAPRGVPQIEVTFDIDANGILNVSAVDKGTGRSQKIVITGTSGLSENEINRMVDDAQKFADDDKRKREVVDAYNKLDGLVFQVEKQIKDNAAQVPADMKASIEDQVKKAKSVLETQRENKDALEASFRDLEGFMHKLSEQIYRNAGGTEQPGAQASQGGPRGDSKDDGVVDAEFESH